MLAARGVSLGLGKINLSELNQLPVADRALMGKMQRLKKKAEERKPKIVVKKHVDKKTLWAACRAVVVGAIIIALGLMMTVLGYFDRDLTTHTVYNNVTNQEKIVVDASMRYKLKSMQYIGPVLMGIGTFLLIIACVITLESRDRHAQIIQEESTEFQRSRRELMNSVTKCSLLPADDTMEKLNNHNDVNSYGDNNGHQTDRPMVVDSEEPEIVETKDLDSSQKNVEAEVHTALGQSQSNPSQRLSQSFRSLNKKVQKTPSNRSQRSDDQLQNAGVLLSAVNLKRPKGPAPIAHFDSQLEMPLSSCSTLATSREEFRR